MSTAANKIEHAKTIIAEMQGIAVALSGGVDSALLLMLCKEVLGANCVAVTAISPIFSQCEIKRAREIAARFGTRHIEVKVDILAEPLVAANPANRCYHCKKTMLAAIRAIATAQNLRHIADGTNANDPDEYRPGLQAAQEAGVRHPLLKAGLHKDEIREALRKAGFENWARTSQTCLATRLPCGERITAEKLAQVEAAEEILDRAGFALCRVRYHGAVARIELLPRDIPLFIRRDEEENLVEKIKNTGFKFVAVDMDGYRSGSLEMEIE